jgi:hypothetical protein
LGQLLKAIAQSEAAQQAAAAADARAVAAEQLAQQLQSRLGALEQQVQDLQQQTEQSSKAAAAEVAQQLQGLERQVQQCRTDIKQQANETEQLGAQCDVMKLDLQMERVQDQQEMQRQLGQVQQRLEQQQLAMAQLSEQVQQQHGQAGGDAAADASSSSQQQLQQQLDEVQQELQDLQQKQRQQVGRLWWSCCAHQLAVQQLFAQLFGQPATYDILCTIRNLHAALNLPEIVEADAACFVGVCCRTLPLGLCCRTAVTSCWRGWKGCSCACRCAGGASIFAVLLIVGNVAVKMHSMAALLWLPPFAAVALTTICVVWLWLRF